MFFFLLARAGDGETHTSRQLMRGEKDFMRHIGSRLVLVSLLFLLAACASGNVQTSNPSPTPKAIVTPTATASVPAGTLLYQSDWSKGLKEWEATHWSIQQGVAQSDLSTNNALTVPYTPSVSNYAVEFRFQIVSVPKNGGHFFLRAQKSTGKDGYVAGILNLLSPAPHSGFSNPEIQIMLDPSEDMDQPAQPSDYRPGTIWHTFSVEVRGAEVDFITDGLHKGYAISTKTSVLSNGPLQLVASGAVVRVSGIRITTV